MKTLGKKGKSIDAWYSGKTGDFGGNIQALIRPDGFPVRVSPVEPGSTHDLTATRAHVLAALYAAAGRGLPTLADPGYEGAGHSVTHPSSNPRRRRTRHQHPHPQRAAAVTALPGRTRLRPAHRPLAHPAARHHQPQQDQQDRPRGARAHTLRVRLPRLLREPQCGLERLDGVEGVAALDGSDCFAETECGISDQRRCRGNGHPGRWDRWPQRRRLARLPRAGTAG